MEPAIAETISNRPKVTANINLRDMAVQCADALQSKVIKRGLNDGSGRAATDLSVGFGQEPSAR